jgi:hypothetical protein
MLLVVMYPALDEAGTAWMAAICPASPSDVVVGVAVCANGRRELGNLFFKSETPGI